MIVRWLAGVRTWTQNLNSAIWPSVLSTDSALKYQNNLCGVWILFRSVEKAEIEDRGELILTLVYQTVQHSFLGTNGAHWEKQWIDTVITLHHHSRTFRNYCSSRLYIYPTTSVNLHPQQYNVLCTCLAVKLWIWTMSMLLNTIFLFILELKSWF